MGEKVSDDFALHQLLSPFCQSLALTSFPQVYPKITSNAFSAGTFFAFCPITATSSDSASTFFESTGISMLSL